MALVPLKNLARVVLTQAVARQKALLLVQHQRLAVTILVTAVVKLNLRSAAVKTNSPFFNC